MSNMHVKKGDLVVVTTGADKGKKGKVLEAMPKENKVVVEGVNVRTKHVKARKAGEESGLVKGELAINASKVNLYCSKCKQPKRAKNEIKKDGTKVRVCTKCGTEFKNSEAK